MSHCCLFLWRRQLADGVQLLASSMTTVRGLHPSRSSLAREGLTTIHGDTCSRHEGLVFVKALVEGATPHDAGLSAAASAQAGVKAAEGVSHAVGEGKVLGHALWRLHDKGGEHEQLWANALG